MRLCHPRVAVEDGNTPKSAGDPGRDQEVKIVGSPFRCWITECAIVLVQRAGFLPFGDAKQTVLLGADGPEDRRCACSRQSGTIVITETLGSIG